VILLQPGETITVRFDNGQAAVERIGPAQPMSKYEVYIVWRAATEDVPPGVRVMPPALLKEGEGPPNPPHPSDGRLQITMRRVPSVKQGSPDNTVLFFSNGYNSTFRYHAVMRSGDRSAATDVCDVPSHMLGLEHWPYVIDQLDLSDFRLVESNGAVQCQ
jgi:hypothetical protein